jgi:RNA polymerase sigma-B factor
MLANASVPSRRCDHSEEAATTERLLRSAHSAVGSRRQELLDQAIVAAVPLAQTVAARYHGRGIDREDLEQIAYEHLVKAVRNYRPTADSDFRSYAVPTIRGGIQHYFRDNAWAVKLPRRLQELQAQINHLQTRLATERDHWPTYQELADELGVNVSELIEADRARGCFRPASLDAPRGSTDARSWGPSVPDPCNTYELVDQVYSLLPVVKRLPPREQHILHRRFVDHYSQAEIGAEIGVSQMQVSRLLRDIMTQLQLALSA